MTTAIELSGFQRDLLYVIADVGPAKGLETRDEIQAYYAEEITHTRVYTNLDTLVEQGLVEKGEMDRRSNAYELSARGKQVLESRLEWQRERFDAEVRA